MSDYAVGNTGHTEFIEGFRSKVPEFDRRSGDHYWVIITTYNIKNPSTWGKDGHGLLDHESLVFVSPIGCYFCEQMHTPLLEKRRCKGEA
jgi:hypothetical protein